MSSPGLRSFKLRHVDRHVRLVAADGSASDLFDDRYEAFARAAADLTALVAAGCPGTVRAISVDFERRVLLATFDAEPRPGVVRIDGDAFDRDIHSLCRALRNASWGPPA